MDFLLQLLQVKTGGELSKFFNGNFFNPLKCVLIGARSIDYPGEFNNLKKAGIKVYSSEDIKNRGVEEVFQEAMKIVTDGTEGFHLSIDTDVMDPEIAPGVSVPEINGISSKSFLKMIDCFMNYHEIIKSIDFVEYNPKFDEDNKTLEIIVKALEIIENNFK